MEKTLSNKTPALTKSTNIDGQLVHLINSLEAVLILKEYFQENKVVTDQTCCFSMSIVYFPFYLSYRLASGRAVLYGNIAISILALWTKKQLPGFLKKVFVFQKISFKVKVVKTFKISSGCHIKSYRSFKQRAISKIRKTVFQKNTCSLSWL